MLLDGRQWLMDDGRTGYWWLNRCLDNGWTKTMVQLLRCCCATSLFLPVSVQTTDDTTYLTYNTTVLHWYSPHSYPYIYLLFNNSCSAAVCVPVTHGTEQEPRDTTEKCPSPPTQPQLPPGVSLITEQLLCHCLL